MGGYAQFICKYYTTLYKGLQHPGILVSKGGPGTNPQQVLKDNCTSSKAGGTGFIYERLRKWGLLQDFRMTMRQRQ